MARTLSSGLAAKATQQYGAEPLIVVKIFWASGTRYYTDKAYTFGANVCEPKILSLGDIVAQQRTDTSSDVSSANIEIDDTDNTIKNSVNRDLLAGTRCIVYQTYNGLPDTDALILLEGRIANDINWTEGQRTLGFTIDTSFNIGELGFAPKVGDVANLSKDVEGRLWPIVFGSCVKVPAVQIYKSIKGKLNSYLRHDTLEVNIENGESFPQGTTVTVKFGYGLLCTGTFTGFKFTISAYNVAYYSNINLAARVADVDLNNPSVVWLSGTQYIEGQYCYVTNGGQKLINYCEKQVGNKCWFSKPWKVNGNSTTYLLPGLDNKITESSFYVRASWGDTYKTETYLGNVNAASSTVVVNSAVQLPGFAAKLHDGTVPTYVCNAVASTAIKGVYAYRTINGQRYLKPVPSSYYTKYVSTVIAGKTVSAITFNRQLSDYAGQEWEDELYVTLVSTLGANTSDVIKYILETFTSYTVDTTTFNSVKTKIANYPSHFAILEQRDVLDIIADIAYQARLAVRYNGAVAKLYYLSELPTTVENFTDDTIRSRSLNYGFTSLDDIITKYVATWRASYDQETLTEYIYKNNQTAFGTKEDTRDFFIYNIGSLVKLSVDFWGNRLSNSWRTLKLQTFLQALDVEPFDCVRTTTTTLTPAGIRGEVTQISHDTLGDNLSLDVKLASKSGTHSLGTPIEDTTFFTGGVTGLETAPTDPTEGVAEEDYKIIVPVDNQPEPQDGPKYYIRIVKTPEKIVRGQAFNIGARIIGEDETVRLVNGSFPIALVENTDTDSITPTTIAFVNGLADSPFIASGGTTNTEAVINIIGNDTYTTALSEGIPITSEPTLVWTVDHTANERGSNFNVTIANGLAGQVYTITLDSQDTNEKLYDGTTEVTSITLNGSGGYSGVWSFRDGTFALNSVRIIATHGGEDQPSPEFLVIDAGGSSSLVVQATVTGGYPGDVVMNSGASWAFANPSDPNIEDKTLGVVGKVLAGDVCYIVCRGLICIEGLTAHTDYNLTALNTLGVGAGKFVLRSYQDDLCWVGGGTAIAKFTDIGDVDDTVTLADGMVAIYNGTEWVPAALDGAMFLISESTDDSIEITHPATTVDFKIKNVALAKIEKIATNSILANVSGSLASATALTASADNTLLRRVGGTLGFGTIGNAFISDLAWSKITGAPGSWTPAVHGLDSAYHSISGKTAGQMLLATGATTFAFVTMGGDATIDGSGILTVANNAITAVKLATDAVTTVKILNANVTNAKLANSTITINGTSVALGGSITVPGFTNPMTTAGDLIIGGVSGAPTRLGVNAGATVQALISVGGSTDWEALLLDLLEDVTITAPAEGDVLTFDSTSGAWMNKPGSNPMTTVGDMIVGGAAGAATRLPVNATAVMQVLTSVSGVTQFTNATLDLLEDIDLSVAATSGQILTFTGTHWKARDYGKVITAIAKVTAQHASLTTEVTCAIYPHGRTTESGDVTWAGVTVKILQIAAGSDKLPVNTWLIVVGTQKVPTPSPLVGDHTDYNWYAQPPIWM